MWNNDFQTLGDKQHRTVIHVREKTNKVAVITIALCLRTPSRTIRQQRESQLSPWSHWVEEIGLQGGQGLWKLQGRVSERRELFSKGILEISIGILLKTAFFKQAPPSLSWYLCTLKFENCYPRDLRNGCNRLKGIGCIFFFLLPPEVVMNFTTANIHWPLCFRQR